MPPIIELRPVSDEPVRPVRPLVRPLMPPMPLAPELLAAPTKPRSCVSEPTKAPDRFSRR